MARRSVYSSMLEEAQAEMPVERRLRIGEVVEEEETEDDIMLQKRCKLWLHRIWRVINWVLVIWLVDQATVSVFKMLKISRTGRLEFIIFMIIFGVAGCAVVVAERTSHDKIRRKSGQIIAIVSEAIMLIPVLFDTMKILFMDLVNAISSKFGGDVFNVGNYQESNLGWFWVPNLILAVIVCISLLFEEQSTDKNLGFARTPQKRDITDIDTTAKDDSGKDVIRISKYRK